MIPPAGFGRGQRVEPLGVSKVSTHVAGAMPHTASTAQISGASDSLVNAQSLNSVRLSLLSDKRITECALIMDTQPNSSLLPGPQERPDADVVVFDGHCRFCTEGVHRLARWDRRHRLAFLSLHDPQIAQLCPDLTHAQLMEQMYLVTAHGQRYGGAAAVRYLSRHMPRLWPLAPVLHIPGTLALWQWFYRQVARRRYRHGHAGSCETDSCKVHLK